MQNSGTATLVNVSFGGNEAEFGGGLSNSNSGTATLIGVSFSGNQGNQAVSFGGGIHNSGVMTLTSVTLSGNEAEFGGGLYNSGTATLVNVTVSGDRASGAFPASDGGGILNLGTAALINVTLSGNSSPQRGGGIQCEGGSMVLTNTIVANSVSGANCSSPLGGNSNLSSDGTCGFGAGRDAVAIGLAPLANNGGSTLTHMLLPGSVAIDFGTNSGCPATDQRGFLRIDGCDIGAFEFYADRYLLPPIRK